MYYSTSNLRELAGNYYTPGPQVGQKAVSTEPTQGVADAMIAAGQMIHIRCIGRCRLHFHSHAWSGIAQILGGVAPVEQDMFSQDPAEQWIEIGDDSEQLNDFVIVSKNEKNTLSQGWEIFLRGIEFASVQPWHPTALPISDAADVIRGTVGTFLIPHLDEQIGRSIKNTGIWAKHDIDFFESKISSGDVVLDIGANIGHHSVYFSKKVGPGGKVFSFEPQVEMFRFASANLVINQCHNTKLLQTCLGNECGDVRLSPLSYNLVANFGALGVSLPGEDGGELVPVATLDSLIESSKIDIERLDFIKIDVQSFEIFVLLGAVNTIKRFKPKIFLEISPYWMEKRGYSYEEIYKLLFDMNYKIKHFHDGFGIEDDIRKWSGRKTEEWDVFCE